MSTITTLFEQAQLAEAAYANFSNHTGGLVTTSDELKTALTTGGSTFSLAQATAFAADWSVVDQYDNSSKLGLTGTGFSATLFQNKAGQYSFAIRGSNGINDFNADKNLIATDGIAVSQLVDLYNYWKSLTTSTNSYQAAKLTTQVVETATLTALHTSVAAGLPGALVAYDLAKSNLTSQGFIVEGGSVYRLEFGDSQFVLPGSHIAIGLNKLPGGTSVSVEGHSLGGHLAMAFSRLFFSATTDATAVNGLGFKVANTNVNNLFAALGGTPGFDAGKIQNVYGIAGPEFASMNNGVLQQPGGWDGIYIEDGSLLSAQMGGHSISQMTDSLAVYNLLARIDPALNASPTGLATLTNLLKASSNVAANSLESVIADLGKLLQVPGAAGFNANEFDSSSSGRDLLYTALKDIAAALPAGGGTSLVAADTSTLTNAQANTPDAVAYRYALVSGNPFVLLGADYSAHNTAGELDLYNPATGQGQLTDHYLVDRSAYLAAKLRDNTSDGTISTLKDVRYNDLDTQTVLDPINTTLRKVTFGSTTDEGFNGAGGNDSLYGGGGNDSIDGGAGNDYIEGNTGNDDLTGGAGNDTLLGGAGSDTYHVGEGIDTLLDADGQGSIYMGTDLLGGGESKDGGHTWTSIDGKHNYALISGDINAAEGATLMVDGSLTVQHYHAGDLGLTLAGATAQNPAPTTTVQLTDLPPGEHTLSANTVNSWHLGNEYDDGTYQLVYESNTQPGNYVYGSNGAIAPGYHQVLSNQGIPIYASAIRIGSLTAASDHLIGSASDDRISAWSTTEDGGNDLIEAGAGHDTVWSGQGNDIISGGADSDILSGGLGNDQLYGDSQISASLAIAQGDPVSGQASAAGTRGDWLDGEAGDDTLIGSQADDVLSGGAGSDLLIAGAGNDYILGDHDYLATKAEWSVTPQADGIQFFYPVSSFPADGSVPPDGAADVIYAGAGDDYVLAAIGNDVVYGESGNDKAWGGEGADVMLGGAGDDLLNGDNGFDIVAETLHGNDYLDGGDGNDTLYGMGGSDTLMGGAGNDTLLGDGTGQLVAGNDYMNGEAGNDTLQGGAGNDTLLGGTGDDKLFANGGANYLDGGDGTDLLDSTGANSTLFGGAGNDIRRLYEAANDARYETQRRAA